METPTINKTKWLVLYYCPNFLVDYHLDAPEAFTDFDLSSLDETGYAGDRITMRVYVYADSQEEAETKLLETYDDENVELR